ncbi:hypothetical protein ACFFX0_06495 [Citricoccus parietis]|uniref:Uncharacterized protein n=1 Tax=Citricoccus parietis TaxID=592307 RepID=A0ABV5FW14_9MICC
MSRWARQQGPSTPSVTPIVPWRSSWTSWSRPESTSWWTCAS